MIFEFEDVEAVDLCASLTGMSAIPIDVTVSATDGKARLC